VLMLVDLGDFGWVFLSKGFRCVELWVLWALSDLNNGEVER